MRRAVICFTRVPRPGVTKTRLLPVLSPKQCAALHTAFLKDLARVYRELDAALFVAYAPDPDWALLKDIFPMASALFPQTGESLGERMDAAMRRVLSLGFERVILTGTDLPMMGRKHLESGFYALDLSDVVLGPTPDGGYYLVGAKAPCTAVFEDQLGYEFTALQYLVPSGRTPKPLFCDREQGLLVMEWLPGRTLDYKTDMDEAAGILADIHSVPVPEGCRLIRPSCPAQAIYEECLDMVQHYYDWEKRDPEVEALLRQLVKETGNLPLTEKAGEGVPLCMVNTELNSGNFLIDPQGVSSLVDWEKPLVSEPGQDLGHFLAPTTTFWKTDVILSPDEVRQFVETYRTLVGDRMDCRLLPERVSLFLRVTCLRGVTWCAMAFREYSEPGRTLVNQDTFRKLKAYMEPEFLAHILDTYVRKDFLA